MKLPFNRVCMVGLGYIGLPTAAVLASRGVEVIGLEVSTMLVEAVNQGRVCIIEPDLDIVVSAAVQLNRLRAVLTAEPADAFIIAVPTPFKDDHVPDLSYIEAAGKAIAPVLKKGDLVILESTSPVGTTEQLGLWLAEARPDLRFPHHAGDMAEISMAYCPERVLPGAVLRELVSNDRVVGGVTAKCAERAAALYGIFVQGECVITDVRTAEMVKLTENAFRDVNIAFANEISLICEAFGINVWQLIQLANRHPRVNILQPGPGVGGHCIAVDPWFIVNSVPEKARLIRQAREVNDSKPEYVVKQVVECASRLKNPKIACMGLSFKANIDDLRESPAMKIVRDLAVRKLGEILVVEPYVSKLPKSLDEFSHVRLVESGTALQEADIILGLVDHDKFKFLDKTLLKKRIVIDTRGIWQ